MVKEAVQQTKAALNENKDRRQTAPAPGQRGATITGLRDEAASFAKLQQRVKTDEKNYSGEHQTRRHILLCCLHKCVHFISS